MTMTLSTLIFLMFSLFSTVIFRFWQLLRSWYFHYFDFLKLQYFQFDRFGRSGWPWSSALSFSGSLPSFVMPSGSHSIIRQIHTGWCRTRWSNPSMSLLWLSPPSFHYYPGKKTSGTGRYSKCHKLSLLSYHYYTGKKTSGTGSYS